MYLDETQATILESCLNNPNLSWQAKGLYVYLISLEDEDIKLSNVIKQSTGGRDATRNCINELKKYGYILTGQSRDPDDGTYNGYEYLAHRIPELIKE